MVRFKNALTKYFIAPMPVGEAEPTYLRFAKWITEVTDDTDETVDSQAYYDGDGTEEDDVTAIKVQYAFAGTYDKADLAHALIASLKLKTGEARKIMLKVEHADGTIYEGQATVTAIKVTGGAASDFEPIECTIAFNSTPTETVAPIVPAG